MTAIAAPLPPPSTSPASTITAHAHIPHLTRIPPTPSPSRPRLLYRGALRLADGTILPGVAFISTVSPFDSSAAPASAGRSSTSSASDADLCLALEMIRRDRSIVSEGILIEEAVAPEAAFGQSQGPAYEVHYESTFHVRMYIDPREQRTVDFFERAFAWSGRGEGRTSEGEKGKVFILHTSASTDGGAGTGKQSVVVYAQQTPAQQGGGPVPMVVGRRILKRKAAIGRSNSGSTSSSAMMGDDTNTTTMARHKPDDPMPRVFMQGARTGPRDFGRSASAAAVVSLSSAREPAAAAAVVADKERSGAGGNHTPGRRGEKRHRRCDEEPDKQDPLKKARDSVAPMDDKATATTADKPSLTHSSSSSTVNRTSVETSNRNTLKRLITHQLLGQGYSKKDDEFNVCFQATYSGSCTALRRVIREKHVDRMEMARIVSEHLDLYVRRVVDL